MHSNHQDPLSEDVVTELSQEPDPPGHLAVPISYADDDPVSETTPLGKATLAVAEDFLKMPLREDDGVNNDKGRHIRTFFLDGLKWSPDTWDHWAEKYPKSGVAKPEWCAAFASYCARKAYGDAQLKLPATPSGSASEMVGRFTAVGRLLKREDVFQDDGCVKEGAPMPGPGDLVIWKGHVGLLAALYPSGIFTTIEGNTWHGSERHDGVYRLPRKSIERRGDGSFKLIGFCQLASKDGITKAAAPQAAPPQAEPPPAPLQAEPPPAEPPPSATTPTTTTASS